MTEKPRKPFTRCTFCGQRVHEAQCVLKKVVGADGMVAVLGIAHKACAEGVRPREDA